MVIEQLAGAVDGWDLALDSLEPRTASEVRSGPGFRSRRLRRSAGRLPRSTMPSRSAFPDDRGEGAGHPDGNDHDGPR